MEIEIDLPKTKLDWFKKGCGFVVGYGTALIVTGIVDTNVDDEDKLHKEVSIFAAQMVITKIVADVVQERVNTGIDKAVAFYHATKEEVKSEIEKKTNERRQGK